MTFQNLQSFFYPVVISKKSIFAADFFQTMNSTQQKNKTEYAISE